VVARNPGLSREARQKVLGRKSSINTRKITLASNRRADITGGNAGQVRQNSVRRFPFNAADSLTLLQEEEETGESDGAGPPGKGKALKLKRTAGGAGHSLSPGCASFRPGHPYLGSSASGSTIAASGMRKNNKAGLVGPALLIWN